MPGNAQPFLRWAGSKRKQLPILSRFWSADFKRYVEPFMGSACLFFDLQPANAVLADINNDLIRTFLAVRDHPQAVSNRLAKIPIGKCSYYSIREQRLWYSGILNWARYGNSVEETVVDFVYALGRYEDELLAEIAASLGYQVVGIDLFRTRLATATKEHMREEVLLLRWPGTK
jgi:hypothetical protein